MFQLARHSKLAAAILLLGFGCGIFWLIDRGAAPAFAQVLENVNKATSVSFTTTLHFFPAPDRASIHQDLVMTWYFQGEAARGEEFGKRDDGTYGTVQAGIFDLATGQTLEIDYQKKTARKRDLEKKLKREHLGTLVDSLSKMKSTDAELTGETIFNGRKVQIYTLKKLPIPFGGGRAFEDGGDAILWVDAESGLPAQILIYQNSKDPKCQSQLTINNFAWNKQVDPKLFNLEAPEGFKVSAATRENKVVSEFAQMLENVNKATSVSFTHEFESGVVTKRYFQGNQMRQEFWEKKDDQQRGAKPDIVMILDTKNKVAMECNNKHGFANWSDESPAASFDYFTKLPEYLGALSDTDENRDFVTLSDGRKTEVFEVVRFAWDERHNPTGSKAKVFVDRVTKLPTRIETSVGGVKSWYDQFTWNENFDAALFKLDIPAGFRKYGFKND